MAWHYESITPGELDALREAAQRAWGDDTRHPLKRGDRRASVGQCYVCARWLVERLGGYVGNRRGHFAWVSPDGQYSIDLTANHGDGPLYTQNDGYEYYEQVNSPRTARFIKRANRIFDNLDSLLKVSLDYMGDAYPAEEPQRANDIDQQYWHDEPAAEGQSQEFKFVYANGGLEVSPAHDHNELAEHARVAPDHKGPVAVGWVVVSNGRATWEVQTNVNIKALDRIFRDYGKQVGWRWGGITNIEGEPISDDFAPEKTSLLRFTYTGGHLYLGRVSHSELLLQAEASTGEDEAPDAIGWIRRVGNRAEVWPVRTAALDSLFDWAEDEGLTLYAGTNDHPAQAYLDKLKEDYVQGRIPVEEYEAQVEYIYNGLHERGYELYHMPQPRQGGNDNVMKTVEDLELDNNGAMSDQLETAEDPSNEVQLHERGPAGLYKCPNCSRLFPRWQMYSDHRRKCSEQEQRGGFPEINMDAPSPFEPHHTPMQPEIMPTAGYREAARVDGFRGGDESDDYYVAYHYGSPIGYARLREGKLADIHTVKPEAHWPLVAKVVKYTEKEPKDLLEAPVPFIYDVDEDSITVGNPGQRTADIPGRFTPGGIVEGTYEPGGKVFIRSMTNMPYTVRHLVELWYYQHPELTVKAVHLRDDAGGDTKLAAEEAEQSVGDTIAKLVQADPAAYEAAFALRHAGGKVFAVGGAVRDTLMGKTPKDIDLMVTGLPAEEVEKVLKPLHGRMDITGKDFGVFRYKQDGAEVEIALPRRERSTGDGHTDFDVQADHTMTPEEDLYRRDFTANALAVDLSDGRLIDPYGGVEDIANGTLRTINRESLSEDPLRVVRALVAKSRHGFHPDEETKAQMQANAESLQYLAPERIQMELDKLFASDNPAQAIRLAHETGVLEHLLPEVHKCMDFDQNNPHHELILGDHLLNVLERTAEKSDDPDLRLAALFHDIGKPDSAWLDPIKGTNHYYYFKDDERGSKYGVPHAEYGAQHEDVGEEIARSIMSRLRYPNDRIDRVGELVRHHMWKAFTSPRGARKFLNRVGDHADDLMTLRWADQGGKTEYPTDPTLSLDVQRNLVNRVREAGEPTQRSQLAINGNDLIAAGIQPGPLLGQILQQLTEAVIEDPRLNQRDTLLTLAQQNARLGSSHGEEHQEEEAEDAYRQAYRRALGQEQGDDEEAQVDEPYFPGMEEAVEANQTALALAGQQNHVLLRPDVLEGALGRAANQWYYTGSLANAAAALAHGVGQAQAFEDGNKRTAYWVTHHFLHENGYGHVLPGDPAEAQHDELADHLIGYGEGTHSMDHTVGLFRQRGLT